MANRDRLTALDAGFLHLERSGAHMHVAGILIFEGRPAGLRRARRGDRGAHAPRPALSPEARPRALRPGTPGVGRRPALQRALPPAPQRAAGARFRRAAAQPRGAPLRPAAGPHEAAVGAQPRRGPRRRPFRDHLQDPPRARRRRERRGHHVGALRHLAGAGADGGRGSSVGATSRADRCRAAGPGAGRACDGARRGRPRPARAHARAAPGGRAGRRVARRGRRDGVGGAQPGAAVALQRADRPAPALHVGRLRGRALQGRSRTRWAGRSTTSSSPP